MHPVTAITRKTDRGFLFSEWSPKLPTQADIAFLRHPLWQPVQLP